MQLTVDSNGVGVCHVRCAGNIRVPDFGVERDPLEKALGGNCFTGKLLLNLEEAHSIDSSGVSWLLRCHRRYRESGGAMVVHSIPPIVMSVLHLLRMEQVLLLADDAAAAESKAQEVLV